jgi:hypothetical protein
VWRLTPGQGDTAYVVRDLKDGKGFDLILDALPISGRVVLQLNELKSSSQPVESR